MITLCERKRWRERVIATEDTSVDIFTLFFFFCAVVSCIRDACTGRRPHPYDGRITPHEPQHLLRTQTQQSAAVGTPCSCSKPVQQRHQSASTRYKSKQQIIIVPGHSAPVLTHSRPCLPFFPTQNDGVQGVVATSCVTQS
mgnify:CR=1 FL=1